MVIAFHTCCTYLFPVRGWKHLFFIFGGYDGVVELHLPLPRQGMETPPASCLDIRVLIPLHLPLPRQGMETCKSAKERLGLQALHLPLPRQGMETLQTIKKGRITTRPRTNYQPSLTLILNHRQTTSFRANTCTIRRPETSSPRSK